MAVAVAAALADNGLRAILSGGGCASIYTAGMYQSVDLDFIIEGPGTQSTLEEAMAKPASNGGRISFFIPVPATTWSFPRALSASAQTTESSPLN